MPKTVFWKYKLFTMVKLPLSKHTSVLVDIVIIILIHVCFLNFFLKLSLNLIMEPYK